MEQQKPVDLDKVPHTPSSFPAASADPAEAARKAKSKRGRDARSRRRSADRLPARCCSRTRTRRFTSDRKCHARTNAHTHTDAHLYTSTPHTPLHLHTTTPPPPYPHTSMAKHGLDIPCSHGCRHRCHRQMSPAQTAVPPTISASRAQPLQKCQFLPTDRPRLRLAPRRSTSTAYILMSTRERRRTKRASQGTIALRAEATARASVNSMTLAVAAST